MLPETVRQRTGNEYLITQRYSYRPSDVRAAAYAHAWLSEKKWGDGGLALGKRY